MTISYTRIMLAHSHAAMHRTELLLLDCRHGVPGRSARAGAQAQWHAGQQALFLAWLDAGGFTQDVPEAASADQGASGSPLENSGVAPLFSAP